MATKGKRVNKTRIFLTGFSKSIVQVRETPAIRTRVVARGRRDLKNLTVTVLAYANPTEFQPRRDALQRPGVLYCKIYSPSDRMWSHTVNFHSGVSMLMAGILGFFFCRYIDMPLTKSG